jgi:hypothetical protein
VELIRGTYPEDILQDILGGYPRDLSAGLILNSRIRLLISRISQNKSRYQDSSGASKFPDATGILMESLFPLVGLVADLGRFLLSSL